MPRDWLVLGAGLPRHDPDEPGSQQRRAAPPCLLRAVQHCCHPFPSRAEASSRCGVGGGCQVSLSALEAVRQNHAHCLEGAILGAYILGLHGYGSLVLTPPDRAYRHLPLFPVVRARDADPAVRRGPGWQLMDLRASIKDDDHVITPFRCHGRFGALSVSNHASLRFRNPVYRSLRELSMSYFDDYMNGDGLRYATA